MASPFISHDAPNRRLLIAKSDEAASRELGRELRRQEGLNSDYAAGAAEALCRIEETRYAALLVDQKLPDMTAEDFCRILRKQQDQTPVFILGLVDGDEFAVTVLDAGANDFLSWPVRIPLLTAKLRACFRKDEELGVVPLSLGPFTFYPRERLLIGSRSGVHLQLTAKEAALLAFIYKADGEPVAPLTLLREVWRHAAELDTHTVQTHIYRLRRKLEAEPGGSAVLATTRSGYRFVPGRGRRG